MTVYDEDARPWLRASDGGYDAIIVDAYRQPYIPFYLATKEFFELVRERLAPGGVVDRQRRPPGGQRRARAGARADDGGRLPDACCATRSSTTNTLLVGGDAPASRRRGCGGRRRRRCPATCADARADRRRRALAPRLPGGEVYTDDHAPVEWLVDRSILGYAADN